MRKTPTILLAALALAAPAAAQDFDAMAWTRTELPSGDRVWIASEDLPFEGLQPDQAVVRVLSSRPAPRAPGLRRGEYAVVEYRFNCDGGVQTLTWRYGPEGPLSEPEPLPERAVTRRGLEGALFEIMCEGFPPLTESEVGSAREALGYEGSDEHVWNPPAGSWDRGPGGEDREPQEPREPPPGDD